jgi:hypothetical protein
MTTAADDTGQPFDLFAEARAAKVERQQALAEALSNAPLPDSNDDDALDRLAEAVADRVLAKLTDQRA